MKPAPELADAELYAEWEADNRARVAEREMDRLRKLISKSDAEQALADALRGFLDQPISTGRDHRHGWELGGERAYLVDAATYDALLAAAKAAGLSG